MRANDGKVWTLPRTLTRTHAQILPVYANTHTTTLHTELQASWVQSLPVRTHSLTTANHSKTYAHSYTFSRTLSPQFLPVYANTHTTTSHTGLQTSCFRLEARQIVAETVNARVTYKDVHSDVVIFTGAGTTAAINKVSGILGSFPPFIIPDAG